MFGRLAQLIDEIEIPVDGEALAEALALRDRLDAAIATAAAAFDAAKLWEIDGARSLTDWLRIRGRTSRAEAARTSAAARRTAVLPTTWEAWRTGTLSTGQVRAIVVNLTDQTVSHFAHDEATLVPLIEPLSAQQTAVVMQHWKERFDDDAEREGDRELFLSETLAGRVRIDGNLDAGGGHVVATALRLAGADELDAERTPARRRADAMVDIAQFFLDHHEHPRGSRHRPHVNLMIDIDRLGDHEDAQLVGGPALDPVSAATLMCDSVVARVMRAESVIIDYGRAIRTVSPSQWNALLLRDRQCRFPDCDVPGPRCEAHHVVLWEDGGPTDLDNLALECPRHHRLLHKAGWHAKLLPDGTFEVTDPKGRTRTSRPPGDESDFGF